MKSAWSSITPIVAIGRKRKEAAGILYWGSSAAWAEGDTMAWSVGVAIARGIPCDRLLVLPFCECSRSCDTMFERG